jgi:hypothetical protein
MRRKSTSRLRISAATLAVLGTAFSCSYGDDDRDDDEKKPKDERKIESTLPASLAAGAWRLDIGEAPPPPAGHGPAANQSPT